MLTQVVIRSDTGESLSLPLAYTNNGYVIREIEGLDPGKSSISTGKIAGVRGEQFQSSRRDARNIILRVGFEPDFANTSVKELRAELYRYLMPESTVTLTFWEDGREFARIEGMVEDFSAPLFTSDPGAVISILCFSPDFRSIYVDQLLHQSSAVKSPKVFKYAGTVKTGFTFRLTVTRNITDFTLVNEHSTGQQAIEFQGDLLAGDVLEINTVSGSRSVIRTRAGSEVSYLHAMSPSSSWIQLLPGDNAFSITKSGTPLDFRIRAVPLYGGL